MVYLRVKRAKLFSSPIKRTRRGCEVNMRWLGYIRKSRGQYAARLTRSCSPLELTAVSTLVASLNAG
jgi:hypothetical protein